MALRSEDKIWDELLKLDFQDVQARTGALYDSKEKEYIIKSLGQTFRLSMNNRSIIAESEIGRYMSDELNEFLNLSILMYLIYARDIPLSETLVRPSDLTGGDIFLRGSHVLPLDKLAQKYSNGLNNFIDKGAALGGEQVNYGDSALRLLPLPRVPVVLIIWNEDEEFPARASFLFDSTSSIQLPTDVLWATALMCVEMMMLD